MRINLKLAAIGALSAASVLILALPAQAEQRHGFAPGVTYHHAYGHPVYGMHGFGDHDRFGEFAHHRRVAPYVVGGIYAGAAVAGATAPYGSDSGYAVGAEDQAAPNYAPTVEAAAPQAYAPMPQTYAVPTVVYRPMTQTYTVPVRSFRYVQHTHYVPVTSYQAVTTNVAVPVTTYQTYQRTVEVPETVYRPVHTCGCSYPH